MLSRRSRVRSALPRLRELPRIRYMRCPRTRARLCYKYSERYRAPGLFMARRALPRFPRRWMVGLVRRWSPLSLSRLRWTLPCSPQVMTRPPGHVTRRPPYPPRIRQSCVLEQPTARPRQPHISLATFFGARHSVKQALQQVGCRPRPHFAKRLQVPIVMEITAPPTGPMRRDRGGPPGATRSKPDRVP